MAAVGPFRLNHGSMPSISGMDIGPMVAATRSTTTSRTKPSPPVVMEMIMLRDVTDALQTGMIWVNSENVRHLPTPFGGTKNTGNGHREAGTAALDFYTEWQSIYVDFSGKLQRAQIAPV